MGSVPARTNLLLIIALIVGCTSPQTQHSRNRESSHLRWLIRLYLQASQQGASPKSESDFKQYLEGLDPAVRQRTLDAADVRSLGELFVSERDGLPYVFFYGRPPAGVATGLIAYEQQGLAGQRYVGYSMGVIEEVDEQRFGTLVPESARSAK